MLYSVLANYRIRHQATNIMDSQPDHFNLPQGIVWISTPRVQKVKDSHLPVRIVEIRNRFAF